MAAEGVGLVAASDVDGQRREGAVAPVVAGAADQAGAGALGTWPARLPKLLSSPIDRVLTTTNEYRGSEATIVNLGGSDHRGVMVRLTPGV